MQGSRELQANDRRDPCRKVKGQGAGVSSFRTGDPIRADAELPCHLADTQPAADPCVRELIPDALPKETTSFGTNRCEALTT
jgi:hypothetical protein